MVEWEESKGWRENNQRGQLIKEPKTLNPDKGREEQGNKGGPPDVHQKTPKNHHSPNSLAPIRRNPLPIIHISIKGVK